MRAVRRRAGGIQLRTFSAAVLLVLASAFSARLTPAQGNAVSGTAVAVRLMEAVDSASDPAGKQYRASVVRQVTTGSGATIAQGAPAIVTLAKSASGWSAQLNSVAIDGQLVGVSSNSASVTSAVQNTAGSAANTVGSMLGAFGKTKAASASTPAVATGQRVVLPPGTALNFVISAPAPANATPAATSPVTTASATTAAAPASAAATTSYYHCKYWGLKGNREIVYSTPVIRSDAAATTISTAFVHFIQANYPVQNLKQDSGFCETFGATPAQQANSLSLEEKQWAAGNWEVVHINWTYEPGQAATAAPAPAAAPAAAPSSGGLYLFCFSDPDGPVIYFSDFFLAQPDPSGQRGVSFRNVQNAYLDFLKQKYAFKSGSNYPTQCSNAVNSEAGLRYAQGKKQKMEDDYRQAKKQVAETGWKYTPPQGAATPAPAPSARPLHH